MASVAIVGAGPAGITAAEILQYRGHQVTLFEQGNVTSADAQDEDSRRALIQAFPGRRDFVHVAGSGHVLTAPVRALAPGIAGGGGAVWGGWSHPANAGDLSIMSQARRYGSAKSLARLGYDVRDWPVDAGLLTGLTGDAAALTDSQLTECHHQAPRPKIIEVLEQALRTSFSPALLSGSARVRFRLTPRPSRPLWPWCALDAAIDAGLDFRPGTRVIRLHIGARRHGVVEVSYATSTGYGERAKVYRERYDVVGLACGAIQTVRLLLLSAEEISPHPSFPHIGRYMMFHVFGPRFVLGPAPGDYPPYLSDILSRMSVRIGQQDLRIPGGMLSVHGRTAPVITPTVNDEYDCARHVFELRFTGNDLPSRHNRVDLGQNYRDAYGLPVARVRRDHNICEAAIYRTVSKWIAGRLREAGAQLVAHTSFDSDWRRIGDHQMGGCRMGDDPADSVVSATCRLHAASDVIVLDGSTFPTAPSAFPTLVVMANAIRVARSM